jgi:hypothetical protein
MRRVYAAPAERRYNMTNSSIGPYMPQITIRSGELDETGCKETLTEYLCDWPDCPNVAVHVVGIVRELRLISVMCDEHAARIRRGNRKG